MPNYEIREMLSNEKSDQSTEISRILSNEAQDEMQKRHEASFLGNAVQGLGRFAAIAAPLAGIGASIVTRDPRFAYAGIAVGVTAVVADSVTVVDPGHVGVLTSLGAINKKELNEGFHFKKPFIDNVVEIDARLKPHRDKAASASRDLQSVTTEVAVPYSVVPTLAAELYQRVGDRSVIDEAIIDPAVQESVKAVTAKYTAEELITKREHVKQAVQHEIQKHVDASLNEKNLHGALAINNVAMTDFDFSPEFNNSIEAKVQAEQNALKAKNEKVKRITDAEAAAAEQRLAADAAAYQIERESKARASALQREGQALKNNPLLPKLRAVEKWDGKLPVVQGGDGTVSVVPIPSLSEMQKTKAESERQEPTDQ